MGGCRWLGKGPHRGGRDLEALIVPPASCTFGEWLDVAGSLLTVGERTDAEGGTWPGQKLAGAGFSGGEAGVSVIQAAEAAQGDELAAARRFYRAGFLCMTNCYSRSERGGTES